MSKYLNTPETISFNEIAEKKFSLSAPQYKTLLIKNENCLFVREFLSRDLHNSDLGNEVGSLNYIGESTHFFLRTKALQKYTFLPEINSETTRPIYPKVFQQMNLSKGDLLLSKDSNIGEIVILDKDYPNHMLSSALYRLPIIEKTKYYLLAFIKHPIFREQLDFLVPSGATIRHAKTLFLDCKIPLPNTNKENVMNYVSLLTQAIINKEILIRDRHEKIIELIEKELKENQKSNSYKFRYPTHNDILKTGRLDTGLYTNQFKCLNFEIRNYKNGFKTFNQLGYKITRGQNLQISNIGKSVYSENYKPNYYQLILSKYFTEYLTLTNISFLGNSRDLKIIKKGEIIFSGRGDLGRVIVQCEDSNKLITNIDNMHLTNLEEPLFKNIFIGLFLNFLRIKEYLNKIAITGSGANSFTKYQFALLPIPTFTEPKQKEISKLYHNPRNEINFENATLANYLELDNAFNENAGIYELDKSAKELKERLNEVIDKIANDENIEITFN